MEDNSYNFFEASLIKKVDLFFFPQNLTWLFDLLWPIQSSRNNVALLLNKVSKVPAVPLTLLNPDIAML